MFGSRNPLPPSQHSTASLMFGLVWLLGCTLFAVGWMGWLLYQGGFRGVGVPILLCVIAFFLWIGSREIWAIGRELWRRKY